MTRVLNKKYWPHQVEMPKLKHWVTDRDPREQWCYDNLKSRNWQSYGWNPVTFAFKRGVDATWFSLVWTGRTE